MLLRQTFCISGTTCAAFPLEKRKVVKKIFAGSVGPLVPAAFLGAFTLALYDVHLETAGFSSGMQAHIDGVSAANAAMLRGMLMEKSKQAPGQARAGV